MYAGSPLVVSLLKVLYFSDDFLNSSASFWATPTISRIWESLVYLVDHLPEVRRLFYLFRAMDLT